MNAVLFAIGAAALFSFGNQCSRLALRHADSQTATLYQIAVASALYWVAAPFYLEWSYWASPVLPILAAIGLIRPFISANLGMAGTRHLGPTIAATLSGTAPLFGVALGVFVLGETLSWEIGLGAAAIFSGVVLLSWRGAGPREWPLWALLLPVGAALIRSIAHVFAKIGMESIPSPFFVALVAYNVSLVLALINAARGDRRGLRAPNPLALPWLLATGVCYGIAVLFLNTALLSGRLIVVTPIVACTPLFTLTLGLVVFREGTISAKVVAAVGAVVLGVVLIIVEG